MTDTSLAQLESRLAGMAPSPMTAGPSPVSVLSSSNSLQQPSSITDFMAQPGPSQAWVPDQTTNQFFDVTSFTGIPNTNLPFPSPPEGIQFDTAPSGVNNWGASIVENVADQEWDLGGLFLTPANWPKNLPSPLLLEHL